MSGKAASGLVKSTVSSSTPQVWRSDMPKPNPLLGTIVFGAKHCPPAVYNIDDVPFHTVVIAVSVWCCFINRTCGGILFVPLMIDMAKP